MRTRRIGLTSTAALLLALLLPPAVCRAADAPLTLESPADGVFVHRGAQAEPGAANRGDIANIGFIVGSRCVAVIDSGGSRAIGAALLAAIRQRTDLPVCYVIHTHVHPDHSSGDSAFAEAATVFVAHAEFPAALAARRDAFRASLERALGKAAAAGSEITVPGLLISGERTLDLGDRPLRLHAWPTAHTNQDLTVFDERSRTLWTGDLLFVERIPIVDGKALGWLKVMTALRAIDAAHLIPGHGPIDRPADLAFGAQQRYLEQLVGDCRAAVANGTTLAAAVDTIGSDTRSQWLLFDAYHRRNVTTVYTELEWED